MALEEARWLALWTHSHCEQLVCDQLLAGGFEAFLPMMRTWSRRAGKQRLIPLPMFPGYLFIRHAIDKQKYIDILKTRGVVRVLGERWDRPSPVPDIEIESLRQLMVSELPVLPHPYLQHGQRVRIDRGPLSGLTGVFLRSKPNRGLLVLSVELLHQSVAVEVDCTAVIPFSAAPAARGLIRAAVPAGLQCA